MPLNTAVSPWVNLLQAWGNTVADVGQGLQTLQDPQANLPQQISAVVQIANAVAGTVAGAMQGLPVGGAVVSVTALTVAAANVTTNLEQLAAASNSFYENPSVETLNGIIQNTGGSLNAVGSLISIAGLMERNPAAIGLGLLLQTYGAALKTANQNSDAIFDFIRSLFDDERIALKWSDLFPGQKPRGLIDPRCNVQFQSSSTFIQRVDPLTLDLDNDGLETTGINPNSPILFDHDADGVKTATGWVKPDDAFLVFDRNNNGLIDTGRELFGDSTQLYAGGLAADGFAALAQEDTNADGLVNASDANWTKLKLWRDLNQDGISQSNELLTLASQNITALKVAKTANSQTLANGNQIADLGGFIRGDGSEGTLGEVTGNMGDINLADNPFYSQFTDSIPLTEAAQGIAEMQGSGRVRSLRQAASLDGNTLVTQVNALAGQSRAQMLQSLDTLLSDWSATSDFVTSGAAAQGYGYSLKYLPAGTGTADALAAYGLNGTDPASLPEAERNRLAGIRQQIDTLNSRLAILERFNGSAFVTVGESGIVTGTGQSLVRQSAAGGGYLFMQLNTGNQGLLEQSYTALKDSGCRRRKPMEMNRSPERAVNDLEWRMVA